MMEGYYILLDLKGRRCVVVGGGSIATRKVEALRRCEADVHIIGTKFCDLLAGRTDVTLHQKDYEKTDLHGALLVFACTEDDALNTRVFKDCQDLGLVCHVTDDPEQCNFTVPAVLKRGPIQIAVGTAGASPYLAGRIRDLIGGWLDRAYEPFARKLAALRPVIVEHMPQLEQRKAVFQQLAGRESFDRFKREGNEAWCEWISKTTEGAVPTEQVLRATESVNASFSRYVPTRSTPGPRKTDAVSKPAL